MNCVCQECIDHLGLYSNKSRLDLTRRSMSKTYIIQKKSCLAKID